MHGVFFWVHLKASLKIEVYYSISRHKRNIIQFGNSMKFDPHEKKHPAIDNTVVHWNCFQCVSSGFIREVLPGSNTYMLYIKLSIPCLKFTKQTPQTYRYLLYGVGDADVYPLQKMGRARQPTTCAIWKNNQFSNPFLLSLPPLFARPKKYTVIRLSVYYYG